MFSFNKEHYFFILIHMFMFFVDPEFLVSYSVVYFCIFHLLAQILRSADDEEHKPLKHTELNTTEIRCFRVQVNERAVKSGSGSCVSEYHKLRDFI